MRYLWSILELLTLVVLICYVCAVPLSLEKMNLAIWHLQVWFSLRPSRPSVASTVSIFKIKPNL